MLKGICDECFKCTGYSSSAQAISVCPSCGSENVVIQTNMMGGDGTAEQMGDELIDTVRKKGGKTGA